MSYALIECKRKNTFRLIYVDEVFDEIRIKLPLFNEKQSNRYGKKINKILKKYNVNNVVLSKTLFQNDTIKNRIYEKNHSIITGENLYKVLIKKCIADICNVASVVLETSKVVMFVHEFSIENLNLVKYISKDVKQCTIVTQNTLRYEKIADDLMAKEGIVLSIFDLEYKNSLRGDFVINIDFTEAELKKYMLPKEAIVISIKENVYALRKNFNGIIINDLDIYFDETYQQFSTLALCEAIVYDYKKNLKENEKKFGRAGYKINAYWGVNGKITEEDIRRVFTKKSKNKY